MNESDLSCWYLHLPRIAQLTGLAHRGEVVSKMESIGRIGSEPMQVALQISIFKDALRAWMRENPLSPLSCCYRMAKSLRDDISTHMGLSMVVV